MTHSKQRVGFAIFIVLLLAGLGGCGKKDNDETAATPAKKQEENVVLLTKDNLQLITIKSEPVKREDLETTIKAAGRVSENANKTAKVASTLEGRLIKLSYDLQDQVKAGDVMGLVQTPELLGKALELKAPIDGVVVERKSTVGELVGKDTQIYTISDPTNRWVLAQIKERDIGAVEVGQKATFAVIAYPNEWFVGDVVRVGDRLDETSRTLEVRIEASNADGRLKAGMFADVEITTQVAKNVLVVPEGALQSEEDQQIVFVAIGDTRFEKRVVRTGVRHRSEVQVLDGLKEGEKIVSEGSFILKSELLKGELKED
ncbi:MAG: efflux RND transporter periplasmic adaptor subunit [Chthoniobacterales bacterium]|nr:efflux RND transporter periplasmic adaptor subunit [Chthoniobacterales bacterium]